VTAGAGVVSEVADQFHGDRAGSVRPYGHRWLIATHTEDMSEQEMQRRMDEWMAARPRERGTGLVYAASMAQLALTFDDGPDPAWTPRVLDALRAASARATFFVLGEPARRHPELVRRALDEGHAVGVHADRHVRHTGWEAAEGEADLDRALAALDAAGARASLWRPPWGVEAPWTRPLARARGLGLVGWSADTHDWRGDRAAEMLAAVRPALRDGAVVLAHDGLGPGALRSGCEETVALIGPLVAAGRERGLEPGALP
jgi:peptidoglycan/xylan/chitin deacetylase (PgdA/CDA1 family)